MKKSTKYLLIENKGELDTSSLILLGASTKREDDSKIGFFGSGNKYALANFLRNKIDFKIYSGNTEIPISTQEIVFRDMTFERIVIDGKETSLTTDMGPTWEPWMAIRELVSNSIDEGSYNIITETENIMPREGYTRFFIEHHPSIIKMIENWNSYFTFDRDDLVLSTSLGKLYHVSDPDQKSILYRKGIRVYYDEGTKALYEYDLPNFIINESRLIDSIYDADYKITKFLNSIGDVSICKNILRNGFKDGIKEGRLPWRWAMNVLSPIWRDAIEDYAIIVDDLSGYYVEIIQTKKAYVVSLEMAQAIRKSFPDVKVYGLTDDGTVMVFKSIEVNTKQSYLLKECLHFCKETNYSIDFPIEIVKFEETNVNGLAQKGTIYLSDRLFEQGKKEIVLTLIEENEHLKTGFKDNTRPFQNHFISMFLNEKEERFGMFL